MSHGQAMLDSHPRATADTSALAEALHALGECAQACALCADACLGEEMVADLRRCIGLNLDCAAQCRAGASIAGRQTESDGAVARAVLEACTAACEACATECARHADMHEHCRVCAESCRRCAEACRAALGAFS